MNKKPQTRFMVKSTEARMEIFDAVCFLLQADRNDQVNDLLYEFVKNNFHLFNLDENIILPKIKNIFYPVLVN